jgi:nucleotide-binding universal stress UspA family protein
MADIRQIVCPVDMSRASSHALEHARALAHWYNAALTILYVAPVPVAPLSISGMPGDMPALPLLPTHEILADVRRFSASPDAGATEHVMVTEGSPAAEITQQAASLHADLIVMGTHGRSGFEHLLIGSVTEKVLRTTTVPVLTVPPPAEAPQPVFYRTILCPIEFSDASTRALEYAISLAEETDARLILLHVIEGALDRSLTETADLTLAEYVRSASETAIARLKAAVPAEARVWCKPDERVTTGKAYREILRVAEEDHVEAIVMGVHGQGVLHRRLFGSTTHHVIREGRWPVLTLRG